VRMFSGVQARRFVDFVAIKYNSNFDEGGFVADNFYEEKFENDRCLRLVDKTRCSFLGILP
jgi:hypothetical protein